MSGHTRFLKIHLEAESTAKDKDFYVFLNKKVFLTKDNLAKRNWNSCKECVLFHSVPVSNIFLSHVLLCVLLGELFISCLI